MSPPISKEWWLAAALTGATATPALGQQQIASIDRKQIGVVTSVQPGAAVQSTPLIADGTRNQRIANDTNAPMHVMFADQSAITIGPKSAVILKDFNYNAEQKTGNIALELTQGVMRVVGGFISKKNPVSVTTKTATIGVRGGIGIVRADDDKTEAAFLFGDAMDVTPHRGEPPRAAADDLMSSLGEPVSEDGAGFGSGQGAGAAPAPIVITVPGTGVSVTFTFANTFRLTAGQLGAFTAALGVIAQRQEPPPPGTPAPPRTISPIEMRNSLFAAGFDLFSSAAILSQAPVTMSVRQLTGSTAQGS